MFIYNHHTYLAMYRTHSKQVFFKPTNTRTFAINIVGPACEFGIGGFKTNEGKRVKL